MNLIFALCGCGVSFYCANTPLAHVDGDCHRLQLALLVFQRH